MTARPSAGAGTGVVAVQGSVVLVYWFVAGLGLVLGGALGLLPVTVVYRRLFRR